jgi:hypothetical protein
MSDTPRTGCDRIESPGVKQKEGSSKRVFRCRGKLTVGDLSGVPLERGGASEAENRI